jgi:hypothetical protein
MSDQQEQTDSLVPRVEVSVQLKNLENALLDFFAGRGLPTQGVLVQISERATVFKNIDSVVDKIDENQKQRSVYISKFLAATASGLFDAALNYLWDQTIHELRRRVAQYDLSYFYDVAVSNPDKRKKLNTPEDLVKLDDSELIKGANDIGLISEIGFKHLDFIRYMRNWASAAHPNQNQITGLQLIAWLETCVVEVINLPLSNVIVEIKSLLANIKTNRISESDARQIATFFIRLSQDRINNLASGFFGIYTQLDTATQTRQNIHLLLPLLWGNVDEPTRQQFGIKYAQFVANNDQPDAKLARQFLEVVSAVSYIPDGLRAAEVETAIENLLIAHRGTNNFYNEPAFAQQLRKLVGETGSIPSQISDTYVLALAEVFLTNANGVAWNAEPIYLHLLDQLNPQQALTAILSFNNRTISSRLQFTLCQQKFRDLLNIMRNKIPAPAAVDLIDSILAYAGPLDKLKFDTIIKRKADNLKKVITV